MPPLLIFPVMIFRASLTAMGQLATQTFPVGPVIARRRAFKVIQGGKSA